MRHRRFAVVAAALFVSLPAAAKKPADATAATTGTAAQAGPRRDPKGIKGISPFWEALKKGDDAYAARDFDGAIAAYQDAIRAEPQNAMGHYRMGEATLAKGNLPEADAVWQTALRFVGDNAALKAKILFVIADVKERERSLDDATNGWNAYAEHSKASPTVKTYPDTATERLKRIATWKQLVIDYGAVKDRIKQRLEEAEKKAAESAQSPRNR